MRAMPRSGRHGSSTHGCGRQYSGWRQELFTLLTASRTNSGIREAITQGQVATRPDEQGDTFQAQLMEKGHRELKGLDVLHFPLAFPHVFLGSRKGFDVILGNPPWEKPMVEEHAFWARHFPGLRARTQREAEVLKEQYRSERPDLVTKLDEERQTADRLRALLIAGCVPGDQCGAPRSLQGVRLEVLGPGCRRRAAGSGSCCPGPLLPQREATSSGRGSSSKPRSWT